MKTALVVALTVLSATVAAAQQSAGFRIEGAVVNAGGRPAGGVTASSASFRVSLDSIGEAASGAPLASASFRGEGGFPTAYLPPLEARALRFTSADRLEWGRDRAAGSYNLYRDLISSLSGLGYGVCFQTSLTDPFVIDPAVPAAGGGFFYLATAVNRIAEEGPKGNASDGTARGGNACP